MKKIVIFDSGGGSNAESILHHIKDKNIECFSFFVALTDLIHADFLLDAITTAFYFGVKATS